MKFVLTKLGIIFGLMGTQALSAVSPTFACAIRPAASTDIIPYNYTCEAYWMARGYYPHYYGSSACYASDSLYEARASSGPAAGFKQHPSSRRARRR
jgi:hypothetical protein